MSEIQNPLPEKQKQYVFNKAVKTKGYLELCASHFYGKMCELLDLFGSKCLPDEEQIAENAICKESKPAKPKFKVSDKVYYVCPTIKHKCTVTKVTQNEHSDKYEYNVMFEWGKPGMWIPESDLEPYTEPEEDHFVVYHEMVDRIIKDGFSKERRLNIATQMASAHIIRVGMAAPSIIATMAFQLADALIAESEKEEKS